MVLITNLTLKLVGHNSQMKAQEGAESRPLVLVRAEEAAVNKQVFTHQWLNSAQRYLSGPGALDGGAGSQIKPGHHLFLELLH